MTTATVPALTFDSENHVYRVDGRIVPHVTSILRDGGVADERWYTEEARDRGSRVHTSLALFNLGLASIEDMTEESRGYVESWRKLRDAAGITVGLVEHRIYVAEFGYAMTLDLTFTMKKREAVGDFKTGPKQRQHAIQLAGYQLGVPTARDRYGIYLNPSGAMARLEHFDDPNDHRVWKACLTLADWRNAK